MAWKTGTFMEESQEEASRGCGNTASVNFSQLQEEHGQNYKIIPGGDFTNDTWGDL